MNKKLINETIDALIEYHLDLKTRVEITRNTIEEYYKPQHLLFNPSKKKEKESWVSLTDNIKSGSEYTIKGLKSIRYEILDIVEVNSES